MDAADELRSIERARLRALVGRDIETAERWHTDLYERRNEHWQVVWSQATGIVANVEGNGRKIAALWQKV
jgi:hypothetical protein